MLQFGGVFHFDRLQYGGGRLYYSFRFRMIFDESCFVETSMTMISSSVWSMRLEFVIVVLRERCASNASNTKPLSLEVTNSNFYSLLFRRRLALHVVHTLLL
jgi:hypothetical protein